MAEPARSYYSALSRQTSLELHCYQEKYDEIGRQLLDQELEERRAQEEQEERLYRWSCDCGEKAECSLPIALFVGIITSVFVLALTIVSTVDYARGYGYAVMKTPGPKWIYLISIFVSVSCWLTALIISFIAQRKRRRRETLDDEDETVSD
jgi:hypothetical protein